MGASIALGETVFSLINSSTYTVCHHTILGKELKVRVNSTIILVGAVILKPYSDRKAQIREHVRNDHDSTVQIKNGQREEVAISAQYGKY